MNTEQTPEEEIEVDILNAMLIGPKKQKPELQSSK